MKEVMPIRVTASWAEMPLTMPNRVTSARRAPNAMACATVSMTLGPGITIITTVARTKARNSSGFMALGSAAAMGSGQFRGAAGHASSRTGPVAGSPASFL